MILLSIGDKNLSDFIRSGVIIDTSTLFEFLKGLVHTQRGSRTIGDELKLFKKIVALFERTRMSNNWKKLFLTSHIMTETCSHINTKYNKDDDFNDILKQVMSIAEPAQDAIVSKEDFIKRVDCEHAKKLESGDISIYSVADGFEKSKKKVAIFTQDGGFATRYAKSPYVMIIDHRIVSGLD